MSASAGSYASRFIASGAGFPRAQPWCGVFTICAEGVGSEVVFPDGSVMSRVGGAPWVRGTHPGALSSGGLARADAAPTAVREPGLARAEMLAGSDAGRGAGRVARAAGLAAAAAFPEALAAAGLAPGAIGGRAFRAAFEREAGFVAASHS